MFEKAIAQPLFPTHIWIHCLKDQEAKRINKSAVGSLSRMMGCASAEPRGGSRQSSQNLHCFPEFAELVGIFNHASRAVLDTMRVKYEAFEITGCWANIAGSGASHAMHTHANNFLSGVYYVQTPPGTGAICFQDPRDQRDIIQPRFEETNQFNIVVQQVAVEAGTLIIFPSWLKHSVPTNTGQDERISISFNVMFSDYAKTISPPRWSGIPLQSGSSST
ncbi:TIGR02466 family protein [Pelagibius sp. Alg239-R121]|uniref:TIGR02466 family protein n=1 Tax=Pelagibius sp. Alg239-R121 TaxID=2993448 RepID=UPI0024A6C4AD|nr:TIGR02466 family protein [Pelagibius sp. Alg239-R121]